MILNFWCLHACKETLHFCVHVLNSLDHTDNKSEFKKKNRCRCRSPVQRDGGGAGIPGRAAPGRASSNKICQNKLANPSAMVTHCK